MIQQQTMIDIADNSGAKQAMCIRVLRGSTASGRMKRRVAGVGDIIICAREARFADRRSQAGRCNSLRCGAPSSRPGRPDGSYVRFDHNAAVVINKENDPVGTRIFGAVARELRDKNFMKIVSLASEVV